MTPAPPEAPGAGIHGLRVALVLNDFRMGGSERQALLLAGELKRRGMQPMILGLAGDGVVRDKARELGVEADAVQLHYPLSPWYFPFNLRRAAAFLRRHRPDVILGYTSVPNLYAGWLGKQIGARLFVWGERNAGLDRPPAFMERTAMRAADAFIANSASGLDFLARACGERRDRMTVVPNAVEIPPETERGRRAGAATLCIVCVAHGRQPKKDHETLLAAWREVRRQGLNARLVLAGYFEPGDSYAERIRALAAEPGLSDSVQFAGAVESVSALLRDADVGLLSSRNEGMPNAVLEYMAAGLPVVATDLPGIRAALGDEAGRWLTPPGDAAALAERLAELLRNPELRAECGRRNRARAIRDFSVAALADRTWTIIRKAGALP